MWGIYLCKRLGLLPKRRCLMGDSKAQLNFLQHAAPFVIRVFSSSNQSSFTVPYLVNSCGLSPANAISASRRIRLEGPENPDSVLALLRNCGCSSTHIAKIITKLPSLLLANPEKTILPKIEFFGSIGHSGVKLTRTLSSNPKILKRSLRNHLVPNYNFLKSVGMGDENIAKFLTNRFWISRGKMQRTMPRNIAVLKENGIPTPNISYLVAYHPCTVCIASEEFCKVLKRVFEMGFNPLRMTFVLALRVIINTSESAWVHKMDVYRRWGWTDDETMLLFKCHPLCMLVSEEKIMSGMDFLVNKMGWQPADIAMVPAVLFYNLKKRIIPRC